MAKRKTLDEQIESAREEKRQQENRLKQLLQKQRKEENKARTNRLCRRGGYLESRLPETITLTDEQYYSFLEKTVFTENARRILNGLTERNAPAFTPRTAAETGETTTATRTE